MTGLSVFAASLTAPGPLVPAGLVGPVQRRFAVYRNNVAVGLIKALEARFPVLRSLVGEEFFGAMAMDFIRQRPPASPRLATFGDQLPDFLAGFGPAGDLPYLADVARIEAARTRAYHAADLGRLDATAFAAVPCADLARLRIVLHPAVHVVLSIHPVWDILAVARGVGGPVTVWTAQAVLIDRPDLDVSMRPVAIGVAAFLAALATGVPLGVAADAAGITDPTFNLATALAELIGCRLAAGLHIGEGAAP